MTKHEILKELESLKEIDIYPESYAVIANAALVLQGMAETSEYLDIVFSTRGLFTLMSRGYKPQTILGSLDLTLSLGTHVTAYGSDSLNEEEYEWKDGYRVLTKEALNSPKWLEACSECSDECDEGQDE